MEGIKTCYVASQSMGLRIKAKRACLNKVVSLVAHFLDAREANSSAIERARANRSFHGGLVLLSVSEGELMKMYFCLRTRQGHMEKDRPSFLTWNPPLA